MAAAAAEGPRIIDGRKIAAQVRAEVRKHAEELQRELDEELRLPEAPLPAPRLLGLINDDTTNVGQVHAGLAYCIDLEQPLAEAQRLVGIREISKIRAGFTHLVESAKLWQTRSQFESWSQFLIQAEIVGAMGGRSWSGSTSAEGGSGPES